MLKKLRGALGGSGGGDSKGTAAKPGAKQGQLVSNDYGVAVIGGGGVGKSAMVENFIMGTRKEDYDPTIEDVQLTFDMLDTAGQEEFQCMFDGWIRDKEGIIMCYSITSAATFEELDTLLDKVLRTKETVSENPQPIVVVGTKLDLEFDDETPRVVKTEQALDLVARWRTSRPVTVSYFEICNFDQRHSEAPFLEMARLICGYPDNTVQGWKPLPAYDIGRQMNHKIPRKAVDDDSPYLASKDTLSTKDTSVVKKETKEEEVKESSIMDPSVDSDALMTVVKSMQTKMDEMDTRMRGMDDKMDALSAQVGSVMSMLSVINKRLESKQQSQQSSN